SLSIRLRSRPSSPLLPYTTLFRSMLEEDLIEAVIGLPANLFYGTGIPACILIINRNKAAEHKGKTFILDGSKDFQEGKNQNLLRDRKSTRLNSSHVSISYAVLCLK